MTFIVNWNNSGQVKATYGTHSILLYYGTQHNFQPANILSGVQIISYLFNDTLVNVVGLRYPNHPLNSSNIIAWRTSMELPVELEGDSATQLCNELLGYINAAIAEGVE